MPKVALLADFSEEYFKKILLGIARYSKDNGTWVFCRMPVYSREKLGLEGMIQWAKEWGADGMFAQLNNEDDTPLLSDAGFPIIVTDYQERFVNVPNITGGYFRTGEMAAGYFLGKGHINFAFYGYSNFVWSRERGEGFATLLSGKGYKVSFFENEQSASHEMWFYKPSVLSQWLQGLPKPVAVMACDDNCGQQVTEACKLLGFKIPEQVAVLGVDNDELICTLSDPPLSSIVLDAEQGGFEAAKLLEQMILSKAKAFPDVVVHPVKIVTRYSTDTYATADPHIATALKYIHQNFNQPITVYHILKHVPLSRRAFEIRFKENTRTSIYQYVIKLRINNFALKLRETDLTVADIAFSLGMFELKNVSRQFKQIMGMNPVEYRKRFKK